MYFAWTDDALAFLITASGHLTLEEIARELGTATGVPLTVNAVRLAYLQHHIPLPPAPVRPETECDIPRKKGGRTFPMRRTRGAGYLP